MAEGIDVPGYLYWSITDNYEWGELRSRFGFYTVDIATDPKLERRATDAVATYRGVVARRGVPAGYEAVKTESGFRAGHRTLPCAPDVPRQVEGLAVRPAAFRAAPGRGGVVRRSSSLARRGSRLSFTPARRRRSSCGSSAARAPARGCFPGARSCAAAPA